MNFKEMTLSPIDPGAICLDVCTLDKSDKRRIFRGYILLEPDQESQPTIKSIFSYVFIYAINTNH